MYTRAFQSRKSLHLNEEHSLLTVTPLSSFYSRKQSSIRIVALTFGFANFGSRAWYFHSCSTIHNGEVQKRECGPAMFDYCFITSKRLPRIAVQGSIVSCGWSRKCSLYRPRNLNSDRALARDDRTLAKWRDIDLHWIYRRQTSVWTWEILEEDLDDHFFWHL